MTLTTEDMTLIVIALLLVLVLYTTYIAFRKMMYRTAFAFGRVEHTFARLVFLFLVLTIIIHFFNLNFVLLSIHPFKVDLILFMLVLTAICWIIYYVSHRTEKAVHPKKR